jgi:hypothetical protein
LNVHSTPPEPGLAVKDVFRILDDTPVLDENMLSLANWIAGYYCSPIGEVLRAMTPLTGEIRRSRYYALTQTGRDAVRQLLLGTSDEEPSVRILRLLELRPLSGGYIEKKLRVDDAVGAVAVHGVCGFYGVLLVGIFAGGYPTGVNSIPVSFGGQLMGMLAFFPLAFLPGFFAAWILKKLNLLRVPPEVELEGLDMAEFQQDFYPEFERVPETIVLPDGQEVEAAPVLIESFAEASNFTAGTAAGPRRSP